MVGEGWNRGLIFNRYRDPNWEDEKVLDMDASDRCTTM